jgi:DNA-binding winged helix-turn-helix (wHTH) protein
VNRGSFTVDMVLESSRIREGTVMSAPPAGNDCRKRIFFGVFEFDPVSRELTKHGIRLKIQEQPAQVLGVLLEQAGQIVSREDLQRRLWPDGTFVDFDHSLNAAVNKLREALGDSADHPVYIETLARRGYRFLAPIEGTGKPSVLGAPKRWIWLWAGAALAVLMLAAALVWKVRILTVGADLRPEVLTSYHGEETGPSLSPDGAKVAFSWNGPGENNYDIYVKQIGAQGPPLRLTQDPLMDADAAWSPDDRWIAFFRYREKKQELILIPPLGGPERRLAEIYGPPRFHASLSWTPDGKWLAYSAADSELGPLSIWAISVETGERRRLTPPMRELQAPITTVL